MIDLGTYEFLITSGALKFLKTREHLPKDLLPANLLLPQEHDELVDVPVFVALMLSDYLAVAVDEELGPRAVRPLTLVRGVQRSAIDASMQHVVLLLKQVFKLLHKQLGLELVFLIV